MKTKITPSAIKQKLETIAQKEKSIFAANDLRQAVAIEALSHEDAIIFFEDLSNHGCICGMIPELIYYCDTHKFFDQFYFEIEELRTEWEENMGEPLKPQNDLKNWFAWFAFEETAYQLAIEFEIFV